MQRSLDGFTLIELVGFGATGEVWRAQPERGGSEVALKWLTAGTVDTELLSGSRLRDFEHPHVARMLDLLRDGSRTVLVQEFIPGGSLAALLTERSRLSSAEVVTLLTPVAEALAAAHEAGLLHGNLTPSALRLTPNGRPVVTDLGVWESLRGATSGPTRLEYLDPAVARGGSPTTASDVFGIAAIGFHALTGRPPWRADSGAATWQLATEGEGVDLAPLRAGVRSRLAEVIARGLVEQPEHRGSARDFAADVHDAAEPEPLQLAGPYLWPDLPPLAELDIAGEVRRGGSARGAGGSSTVARHAATPKDRRAARVVPRRAVIGAIVALAVLSVVVLGLGWNASKAVPAQAGGPVGEVSSRDGVTGSESESDSAEPGRGIDEGIDERAVPNSPEQWSALLTLLYQRRAVAFGTGALSVLDQVFTADSPQLVADATELTRLVNAGQVLRGFDPHVREVIEASVDDDRASLRLTDEFGDYETVPATDVEGSALADNPGRGPTTVSMTLVLTENGWRIHTAQRLE